MISYNDLYEIVRKEKYSETLQILPKEFIEDVAEFLSEKKQTTLSDEGLFEENAIKSKKQLENSISLFKELMRLRKRKLLSLIFVATETGIMKRDYENMLNAEKELFESIVKIFETHEKGISKAMSGKKLKEGKYRMIMFNQSVEQFIDLSGNVLGPFASGELVNLDAEAANIFVSGGKARFVDEG